MNDATTEVVTEATTTTEKVVDKKVEKKIMFMNSPKTIGSLWAMQKMRLTSLSRFSDDITLIIKFCDEGFENQVVFFDAKDHGVTIEKFAELLKADGYGLDDDCEFVEGDEEKFVDFNKLNSQSMTKLGNLIMDIANTRFPNKASSQRKFSIKAQKDFMSFTLADVFFNNCPEGCEYPPKKSEISLEERVETIKNLNKLGHVTEAELYEIVGDVYLKDFFEAGIGMI